MFELQNMDRSAECALGTSDFDAGFYVQVAGHRSGMGIFEPGRNHAIWFEWIASNDGIAGHAMEIAIPLRQPSINVAFAHVFSFGG